MGVSITEKAGKIKGKAHDVAAAVRVGLSRAENGLKTDFFIAVLFVGVTVIAFSLGRISALEKPAPGVVYIPSKTREEGVIASKTGTKYHFPWCSGALSIREDNKLYFASALLAQEAGYTPAGNCKGLK